MRICELPEELRPREKAWTHGLSSLSDIELLALLIGKGTRGHSALAIAEDLLKEYRSLSALGYADPSSFTSEKGLSRIKALELGAVFEAARRYEQEAVPRDGGDAYALFERHRHDLGEAPTEHFLLLLYDRAGRLLKEKTLFIGDEASLLSSTKVILSEALSCRSSRFVIVHNHPSGNPLPSQGELSLTRSLGDKAKELGLSLGDHLIVSAYAYYSFAENGILSEKT
jgi:DNA repair protein RadC